MGKRSRRFGRAGRKSRRMPVFDRGSCKGGTCRCSQCGGIFGAIPGPRAGTWQVVVLVADGEALVLCRECAAMLALRHPEYPHLAHELGW